MCVYIYIHQHLVLVVKNSPANAGDKRDTGSITGSGRSSGEGHGNPLQYSCLENPMDREAWWAVVYRVTKSRTRLKQLSTIYIQTYIHTCIHIYIYYIDTHTVCVCVCVCVHFLYTKGFLLHGKVQKGREYVISLCLRRLAHGW